jgi:hypothetical protein
MLGVVIASPERSRFYFKYLNAPCFPVAAAPDRSVHRAYGLPAVVRTPDDDRGLHPAGQQVPPRAEHAERR